MNHPAMSRQAGPRPILKCASAMASSSSEPHHQVHHPHHPSVRFPSSPKLSTVHLTHCSKSYDRTPIVVGPNTCALPERGCRTYAAPGGVAMGNHLHPSAFNRDGSQFYDVPFIPPQLSTDEGSSEESDGLSSPPSEDPYHRQYVPSQAHLYSEPLSHPPIPRPASSNVVDDAPSGYSLSFLPHAPPMVPHGRKKPKHHRTPSMEHAYASSSWCQSDESSCLGGF